MDHAEDPIVESIWKHLIAQKEKGKGIFIPRCAAEMANFITQFCVGFFDYMTCKAGDTEESIHQIFENSITKAVR